MFSKNRPLVCIQGLGFVGSAMSVAVAGARDAKGRPYYNVVGIELPGKTGEERAQSIKKGIFPFKNADPELKKVHKECIRSGNLYADTDSNWFQKADIVISDINLDLFYDEANAPYLDLTEYKKAIHTLGQNIRPDALLIIETTVPPGTCEKVVEPIIKTEFRNRGLDVDRILLAHSYERVMPGADYYNSIVNYWRVYSGINDESAALCEQFLSRIVNTKDYPLTRLERPTASETAKVLENSYRAVTIAFMEEWGRFAEAVGFDLFNVVDAIRMRPTHSNMRQPGFGVGGYCLTKDPYFAMLGAKQLFETNDLRFPFCVEAADINRKMPLVSLDKVEKLLGGDLNSKKLLLLGISYRQDVGDTRCSPAEIFAKEAVKRGAFLSYHDPLVRYWAEMNAGVLDRIPEAGNYDAVIFTVPHREYSKINMKEWMRDNREVLIFDANHVLTRRQLADVWDNHIWFSSIGRGGEEY